MSVKLSPVPATGKQAILAEIHALLDEQIRSLKSTMGPNSTDDYVRRKMRLVELFEQLKGRESSSE